MIQTKVRRRSSLIWGTLLALLLGVAAAFVVLAMPIRMLETVTTATRLSKLMVQAEPPISPNDRTLLAVLSGIFIAGIGWVLVDWLLFGRAGMSTLIRTRDDDYEDEDEDAFRPTDPLDLVTPMVAPPAARTNDWAMPNTGDARRPLSARTDIGDPPMAMPAATMAPPAIHGVSQALPPLGQILPGAGVTAPPLPSAMPIPPIQQPQPGQAAPAGGLWDVGAQGSWPPLDLDNPPVAAPALAVPAPAPVQPNIAPAPTPPANMPSWLPAPGGARPGTSQPDFGMQSIGELPAGLSDAFPMPQVPPPLPFPDTAGPEPMIPQPTVAPSTLLPEPPVFAPGILPGEPMAAAPAPEAIVPPPFVPQPAPVAQPAPAPRGGIAGFEPDRLEDLLVKLERTVRSRRAAAQALAAPAPVVPAPVQAAPLMAPVAAAPAMPQPIQRMEPPVGFAAPPPMAPVQPTAIPQPAPAPPVFQAAPQPAPVAQSAFPPEPTPAPVQSIIPVIAPPAPAAEQRDAMLEQPLHLTLDQLRNMVRR